MIAKETIEEIESAIIEQGSLTKAAILDLGVDETDYPSLRQSLLDRGRVDAGPQRTGGFKAKRLRGPLPADDAGDKLLTERWEGEVVARLVDLFQHHELEELLGDLTYTVVQSRVARGGERRRGAKPELATALVVQHGMDLLADTKVRCALAKKCGLTAPGRWHPGKPAATQFVQLLGLPLVLAGLASDEAPPSVEYLEGRVLLKPLEDFQEEVRQELTFGIVTRGHRSIVTLPTGAGKTRVAVQGIKNWLYSLYDPQVTVTHGAAVLWLAHTEELCEQACACFRQVWQGSDSVAPLQLIRFWAGHTHDLSANRDVVRRAFESPSVLVSTPQRIVNLLDRMDDDAVELVKRMREGLGLLAIDEAHRAAAPSYRRIMEEIAGSDLPVVGLTATPFRNVKGGDSSDDGARELQEIFVRLIEPQRTLGSNPRLTLQKRGVLAEPLFAPIDTRVSFRMPDVADPDSPTEEAIEEVDRQLRGRADKSQRRLAILEHLVPLARDPRNLILYFGPSVRDAECMTYLLRERGIPAAVVSGTTREATRRRLIDRFKRAELRVLCNCEVLATGFDAPRVTHVVMGRPTVSQVLYEQMVGRGMRGPRFGGTLFCTIMDCVDDIKGPMRPELGYKKFQRVWKREMESA